MVQIRRVEARDEIRHADRTFTFVGETWTIRFAWSGVGLSWVYHRPRRVESGRVAINIHDHVMAARIAASLVLAGAALVRRSKL